MSDYQSDEIGGYFPLELNQGKQYHEEAYKLNNCRNGIELLLKEKKYTKIFIPNYSCDALLIPINNLGLEYEYYNINSNFEVEPYHNPDSGEAFLYINHFGLKNEFIKKLTSKFSNLIIDNSQAFYSLPITGIDTVYSPRKFFGAPDGGYLYTDCKIDYNFEIDHSYSSCEFLMKRCEYPAPEGYDLYRDVENKMDKTSIKRMSLLTEKILSSINYEKVKLIRERNFLYLHSQLKDINEITIEPERICGSYFYPLLLSSNFKEELIKNKIYVPTFWKEVLNRVDKNSIEYKYTENIHPLPIDQRYGLHEMKKIVMSIQEKI